MSEKALVTGGAGFIGSHLARKLLKEGYDVVVLDDLSGGFRENLPEGATFVEGSILDRDLLGELFEKEAFDYVFHLAAYAAEGLSHFIKHFNYQNNLIGSVNLINASILNKIKCFVFTSSIATYGEIPPPMRESDVPKPEDPYGVAKLAVEMELEVSKKQFGLDYVIFRPHNVYGEFQNLSDRYRNVIGIFMNQIMQGNPLSVFGDGEQTRAFSYIEDLMGPMAECIKRHECSGEIFNIGADKSWSVKRLAYEVQRALGSDLDLLHLPPRNEVEHANADHSKLKKFFGDLPQTDLAEGIDRMAKWAKSQGPTAPSRFGAIEIEEGLPSFWRDQD
jgi:UDP-glucose 4-epimerase